MTGQKLVEILNKILPERGISKGDFCRAVGVSPTTYSHWAKGSEPKSSRLDEIEKYLGIRLSDYEKCDADPLDNDDVMKIRERLLRDPNYQILFDASDGAPASVYHEAAALFYRWKEESKNK